MLVNSGIRFGCLIIILLICGSPVFAQEPAETPPPPGEPPNLTLPEVREMTLPNGLQVVVVERRGLPLVTASLLVKSGASSESGNKAGLASMTAELLTKGTPGRSATQIAEQIEFLGATMDTGAGWNGSSVTVNVTKDKLGRALAIMSDVVIRPTFPNRELALSKRQTLDGFSVGLKQPGVLMNLVASRYSYGEHPENGTPQTVRKIQRSDLVSFHKQNYIPGRSVLIFTGDISPDRAFRFARLFFGGWNGSPSKPVAASESKETGSEPLRIANRILVIDLPASGQAAVGYAKKLKAGRTAEDDGFFAATVLNSVLGGGYSARLNQEIRLKRGLSYGARSGFSWRIGNSNFIAVAQTKNESAGEVAELIRIEIEKLVKEPIGPVEMTPRKAVVTGGFGRSLQTNSGLANQLRDLYAFGLSAEALNSFTESVKEVDAAKIRLFAGKHLVGGDMIIVGDASKFLDDLKGRFEGVPVRVIKSDKVNLNSKTLK